MTSNMIQRRFRVRNGKLMTTTTFHCLALWGTICTEVFGTVAAKAQRLIHAYRYALRGEVEPLSRHPGAARVPPVRRAGQRRQQFALLRHRDHCPTLNKPTGLKYEGFDFAVLKPTTTGCSVDAPKAVTRLFNNKVATNEGNRRYVESAAAKAKMLAQACIGEGAVFCSASVIDAGNEHKKLHQLLRELTILLGLEG